MSQQQQVLAFRYASSGSGGCFPFLLTSWPQRAFPSPEGTFLSFVFFFPFVLLSHFADAAVSADPSPLEISLIARSLLVLLFGNFPLEAFCASPSYLRKNRPITESPICADKWQRLSLFSGLSPCSFLHGSPRISSGHLANSPEYILELCSRFFFFPF